MAKKTKKVDLEKIPEVLEKFVALMDQQANALGTKDQLSSDDVKNIIACAAALTSIYKDYRAERILIEKELKSKTKEEIQAIIKAEVN